MKFRKVCGDRNDCISIGMRTTKRERKKIMERNLMWRMSIVNAMGERQKQEQEEQEKCEMPDAAF